MSTEKKFAASTSTTSVKATLSAVAANAIKFDKLFKLTESSDYRTWHDTAESILDSLEI